MEIVLDKLISNLPPIKGTAKQVAWANKLRDLSIKGMQDFLANHLEQLDEDDPEKSKEYEIYNKLCAKWLSKDEAVWWIEYRLSSFYITCLESLDGQRSRPQFKILSLIRDYYLDP